jgi:tetratricopeptide (TPR) repeat protein
MAIGLTVAPLAHAGDSGRSTPGPDIADIAAAQALFERGRELMAQRRAAEACGLFEESQRIDAGLGTQYNLANCYEAVGRFASAYTLFLEVSATARARGQAERAREAASRARGVEPKLARLIIEVESEQRAALTVERDGSAIGSPQWGIAVPVDPGWHQVRAHGPGLVPWSREIKVEAAPQVYTVSIPALPADAGSCDPTAGGGCSSPPDRTTPVAESYLDSAQNQIGLVALGVGVAGLGLSIGLAIRAHSKNESAEARGCNDRGCPTIGSLNLRRQARSAGNWATVSGGIGLFGAAAAGILFWVWPEPDASAARVVPHVSGDITGVEVYGRF